MENVQSEQSILVERTGKEELNGKRTIKNIEGTPFQTVDMDEYGIYLIMGKEVLKIKETEEEILEYIKEDSWELRLNAAYIYCKHAADVYRKNAADYEKNTTKID